jgi:hypothetical protein
MEKMLKEIYEIAKSSSWTLRFLFKYKKQKSKCQ